MKHEIIELHDVQMIGMAKKIAFNEAKEECPRFSNHNCATCWEANFGACKNNTFTYVIGGIYKGGDVPEGMHGVVSRHRYPVARLSMWCDDAIGRLVSTISVDAS